MNASFAKRSAGPIAGFAVLGFLLAAVPCLADGRVLVDVATNRWKPMWGSAPAQVVTVEGRRVLHLTCAFATSGVERASWDVKAPLDLSDAPAIRFEMLCTNPAPVASFSIYFESGKGWYHAEFSPESVEGWDTITIDKDRVRTEGEPAGWDQVRSIRISAWRGSDRDTEFFLGDLTAPAVRRTAPVLAIIRGDSATNRWPDEAKPVSQFASDIAGQFRALEIEHEVLSDGEVSAERLAPFQLVVLPHNPNVPDAVADELVRFVGRGGRLLTFYSVPPKLRAALGLEGGDHVKERVPGDFASIRFVEGGLDGAPPVVGQRSWNISDLKAVPGKSRVIAGWFDENGQTSGHAAIIASSNGIAMTHVLLTDDAANKRRMLMAMAGHLVPDIWKSAAEAALARVGTENGFRSFEAAVAQIRKAGGDAGRAAALREAAKADIDGNRFAAAIEKARAASRALLDSWCAAQRPEPGEFRAFWCHDAFGVSGLDWDTAIARLATNGFTAIFPNMLWGGAAFYDSDVLPVTSRTRERGDQIAACVAACRKHGVQIHVWKVSWYLGHTASRNFTARMRGENRLQKDAKGEELDWLCPSHPENQQLEVAAMVEVARKYDVDGLHFDYIRYPDADHCYCDGCRGRFEAALGAKIGDWPAAVLPRSELRKRWLDWRQGNITAVVQATSEQARAIKPKIRISAAVFRNWASDRFGVGQDWKLWCNKGWLDFVCPMDYTESNRKFDTMVAAQIEWAGKVPVYPGIGVSASSSRFGPDRVIEQIGITRRHRTGGFILFNYGVAESRDLVPLLGLGITRRTAEKAP